MSEQAPGIPNGTAAETALGGFRQHIDRTDRALLDQLRERASVVALVGEDKRARGVSDVYRPGREAALLRKLVAADCAPFPKSSLVGVWREVIGASFAIEGHPLNVVSAGPAAWERARGHFRAASHARVPNASDAVRAVADGTATLGVVALDDGEPWWPPLAETPNPPHIVARLPFAPEPYPIGCADALVLACNPPDPSGRDRVAAISPRPAGETLAEAGGRFLVAVGTADEDMLGVGGYAIPLSALEVGQ